MTQCDRAVQLPAPELADLHGHPGPSALAGSARGNQEPAENQPVVLVTDGKFAQFIERSPFVHVRGQEPHPQMIGMVERFHQSYKYEEVYLHEYRDPVEAAQVLARYRRRYNWERPHQALGYRVPGEGLL